MAKLNIFSIVAIAFLAVPLAATAQGNRIVPTNEVVITGYGTVGYTLDTQGENANRFTSSVSPVFLFQFQDRVLFEAEFELAATQLSPHSTRAEVVLLAKGVQRRHKIRINGATLEQRLEETPDDGGFGEFRASFDADLLRRGPNKIEIIAKPSSSDIDDFEFVNVQILLSP